ncbi:AraC family transcriptional regulator [Paenibacillus bouchesdurhonensis]|uniref:AraC family transcriptional regulator n=1 Tax=Paenibacillus bouchesdurhonensis TaxID=1870990 RepID=UPI000DA61D8E|nr:AraC family transcriptional regulator [Paenibacillus bouchesdurhonensis]
MTTKAMRRFVFSPSGTSGLPISVESIGYNPEQEPIARPDGYPKYHWIQTEEGEGTLNYANETIRLTEGTGVLLPPGLPHSYEASSPGEGWRTYYLTFGGEAAAQIISSFGVQTSSQYRLDTDSTFVTLLSHMLARLDTDTDMFGLETSIDAYRFLGMLSKYGQINQMYTSRNIERLIPVLKWMEESFSDSDVGLDDFAEIAQMSGRQLSKLFQRAFGLSPYAYFVQMRIHKAKELLAGRSELTVAAIAEHTGFRDPSHFVATFRKNTGMTPQHFRKVYS